MWSDPKKFEWIAQLSHYVKNLPHPNSFCQFLAENTLGSINANAIYLFTREKHYSIRTLGFIDSNFDQIDSSEVITLVRTNPTSIINPKYELSGTFSEDTPIQVRIRSNNALLVENVVYIMTLERLELQIGYLMIVFDDLTAKKKFGEHHIFIDILINLTTAYLYGWTTQQKLEQVQLHSNIKTLTQRQKDLIRLFPSNKTVDEMAGILGFSQSTIKKDLIEIYTFFETKSRIEVHDMATLSRVLS